MARTDVSVPVKHRSRVGAAVTALRPRQWIKNLLVFMAPAAAGVLRHPTAFLHALGAFGVFCAAASGSYLMNDVADIEADRRHPHKVHRPVASGRVSVAAATGGSVVLMALSLAAAWLLSGWPLTLVIGVYLAVQVAYTFRLKVVPVVELAAVAAGFVLRAIAGGAATHVPLTSWFLVVTSFGALFMVVGKRTAEYTHLGEDRVWHRPVLDQYTTSFLKSALTMSATVTVTAYCLWAFDRGGLADHSGHHFVWIELTVAPVVIGVLYVLWLLDAGKGGAPEELALRDHLLQALGVAWAVLLAIGLYG